MFKKQNGITLIALVVTIIVLLILAAVSINALVGENGIANRAKKAADQTTISEIKEEILLAYDESVLEEADTGATLSTYMQNLLRKKTQLQQ